MRVTRAAFHGVTLLLVLACLPSLAMWSFLTYLAFRGLTSAGGLALATAIVTPGWLGWLALGWATWRAFRAPQAPWPPWVRTSIAIGGIVAFWVALFPMFLAQRKPRGSLEFEWFAMAGGPALLLAVWLMLPGLGDKVRHLRQPVSPGPARVNRPPP
jgi:hypothetical protein